MVTSNCISQIVTKTNNQSTDSLICMPKSIALKVIQDLERGDMDSVTVTVLRDDLNTKDRIIEIKDSIITKQDKIIFSYEKSVHDYNEIDAINQQTIKNLNRDLNRERKSKKVWRYIAGGFALLSIIVAK